MAGPSFSKCGASQKPSFVRGRLGQEGRRPDLPTPGRTVAMPITVGNSDASEYKHLTPLRGALRCSERFPPMWG